MRTHNTPRLCAGPQTAGTPIKFWNVASIGDDEGEITLYGDVVSRQPVDWWTGEPEPGLYIAPESFMEDLAAVKGKSNITIKINSCGGDLYTGIAIHNAIKGLTGHKVVVVEGIAASAASVIACAGDEVQVYPGSMVMIHGVAGLLYDYYTLADLKKLQKDFDASERAIAEIYHAKTGIEVDQLRSMMTRETWMVGQEAIDNGFADTLLTDEGPDVTLSADKKVLLVAGIRHDVKGFRHIPGTIPIDNSIHAAPAAGNKHAAAKNDGPKKEDNKCYETARRALKWLKDPELIDFAEWLLWLIIDSTPDPGIPIGNQSSQLLALLYLDAFDHWLRDDRGLVYGRYMDDFYIIHSDKLLLRQILKEIEAYIKPLGLRLNGKTQILPLKNGIDFLGFHTYLTQTGKVVRKVRAKSIDNMKRKIRKFRGLVDSGKMTLDSVVQSYASWTGHISHGNTYHLRQNMDAYFFSYFPELKPSPKGDTTHGPKTEQPCKQVEGQVRQPVRQPDRLDRGR